MTIKEMKKTLKMLEYKCKCGKVIRSLYPKQLAYLKRQHEVFHEFQNENKLGGKKK